MEMEGVSPDKSAVRRLGEPRASRKMHTRVCSAWGHPREDAGTRRRGPGEQQPAGTRGRGSGRWRRCACAAGERTEGAFEGFKPELGRRAEGPRGRPGRIKR